MKQKFFYYQKNAFGQWSPCTSDQRPSEKLPEGKRVKIKQVVQLHPSEHFRLLSELQIIYPLE